MRRTTPRRRPPTFDPATAAVIERGFTQGVAERVDRGGFTFSDRAALLAAGERLGIDRFRANLIIVDRQNRTPLPPRRSPFVPALVAVVAVQSAVIAAGLWAWMV